MQGIITRFAGFQRRCGGEYRLILTAGLLLATLGFSHAGRGEAVAPDSLVLKDGSTVKGLIVQQTSQGVTLQKAYSEITVPNEDIVRIYNVDDEEMSFVKVASAGQLPPWRVIANDLRHSDNIKTFEQIPATAIDEGTLKNVPYLSFQANKHFELNIYGDPENPAAIEVGVYGPIRRSLPRVQNFLRGFFASYLGSVEEINTLYSLSAKGESRQVGPLMLEVTPPGAPDAYGGWWITISNPKKLEEVRLSDTDYARLTRPVGQFFERDGSQKREAWRPGDLINSIRARKADDDDRVFLRGFYRDKNGRFQILSFD